MPRILQGAEDDSTAWVCCSLCRLTLPAWGGIDESVVETAPHFQLGGDNHPIPQIHLLLLVTPESPIQNFHSLFGHAGTGVDDCADDTALDGTDAGFDPEH